MRKLLSAIVLVVLCAACGGGGDDPQAGREPDATSRGSADPTAAGSGLPEGVEAAPEDGINRPQPGKYVYDFDGQSTSAARATADPVRAPQDAEFTSEVRNDGDETTMVEQSSFGSSVTTTTYRWEEDRVLELSIETKSSAGTVGCEMTEPIEAIRVPIEKGSYGEQNYEGEGAACDRTRTIEVLRQEDVRDAEGRTWSTWVFEIETTGRSVGLTEEFTETKWFSPDLGKDIKTEVTTTGTNAEGGEVYEARTSTLLKRFPT